jgi:ribosomal protein L11 methyltransferase
LTHSYTKIIINSIDEVLLALLASDYPIESIEELESETNVYIKSEALTLDLKNDIDTLAESFNAKVSYEPLEDQNWNQVWESNFSPVEVETFCRIRAEFHDASSQFEHEIVIQPKMAFGTGHHQTTYMMIKEMHGLDFINKSVYDYGCGTGILAIYAAMLGATEIDAVDIENESYLNTVENAERNNITYIKSYEGDITATPDRKYDIILANINRNILLDSVDALQSKCNTATLLLLSGILAQDVEIITETYQNKGFKLNGSQQKGDWMQLTMSYNP